MAIKTAAVFLTSEADIVNLIKNDEKYILERNSTFTVMGSDLEYVRNIKITLKVAEWNIRAAGGWTKRAAK